jgi:hypothetical protein
LEKGINNNMPYNISKSKKGYKVRYKKGGKMHTIPGASVSKEKAKKRIAAIEISKHMHENQVQLPSEENVVDHEVFDDPFGEEAKHILSKYELDGDQVQMAYDHYAAGEVEEGQTVIGTKLKFRKVEHKGNQEHVVFDIEETHPTLSLEMVFVDGDYKECIISNEAKEDEQEEEQLPENFSFEQYFEYITNK